MDHLDRLENQSIYIIREAFTKIDRLAMLWSVGKDSQTIIWLARKAFFGHVPFPCVFMETSYDMPELIELRDRLTVAQLSNATVTVADVRVAEAGQTNLILGLGHLAIAGLQADALAQDRKSTRLNSSHRT